MYAVFRPKPLILFMLILCFKTRDISTLSSGQGAAAIVQWNAKGIDSVKKDDALRFSGPRHTLQAQSTASILSMNTEYSGRLHSPGITSSPCDLINGTRMDCSGRGLKAVPEPMSKYVNYLNLANNSISDLPDSVFAGYPNLSVLIITSNKLTALRNCSFCGLSELRCLDLWNNRLLLVNTTYPDNVFKPLQKLTFLRISRNNRNCTAPDRLYPDTALSYLVRLKYLYIDGLAYSSLGPSFQNLTSLTTLSFAGYLKSYCFMFSLNKTTFQYLTNLTYLDLSDCHIDERLVEHDALESLTELEVLNLSHNENLEFRGLTRILYGIRNSKLKKLMVQLITDRFAFGFCLHSDVIEYLPKTIEYLDVRENNIYAVDRDVIGKLPPALVEMDISGNLFGFATYFMDLHLMRNLTTLRLNGASYIYPLPSNYPYSVTMIPSTNETCTPYSISEGEHLNRNPFVLVLPPKLESIEMDNAGLRFKLTKLVVNPNNSLQRLSLHGNFFESLDGPFEGLYRLEYLDLSSCSISYISNDFFTNLTALRYLNLSFNFFGSFLSAAPQAHPFSMLNNLILLNLSSNSISSLPATIFHEQSNLSSLLLNQNPISDFSIHISQLKRLKKLNLSSTNLARLPLETRNSIDSLLQHGVGITVDMSNSEILCDCGNLDFLEWMKSSKAFNHTFLDYKCVNPDSSLIVIKDGYNQTLSTLRRKCLSHLTMFLAVTAAMLFLFIALLGLVIYRFRWKLRYFYYAAYLYLMKYGRSTEDKQFKYDAFISYDHKDETFVREKLSRELDRRGLKVCIHDRDFTAGDYIASNIIKAVCNSRKTLVVLTQHMISSYWCNYEIQMANMESVHTGRQVLVFLLMAKIPNNISMELRYNISNNTYIAYPDPPLDVVSMDRFWDKLALDLKD